MVPRVRAWVGLLAAGALIGACAGTPASRSTAPGEASARTWIVHTRYAADETTSTGSPSADGEPTLLTTDRLRVIAHACGVGNGPMPMPLNQEVGTEFQQWALQAFPGGLLPENYQNYLSQAREQLTRPRPRGPIRSVRPDAVGQAVTVVWEQLLGQPRPRTVPASNSVFVEVKAVKGGLTLSHSAYQITGLIDVAANSPAARMIGGERPIPALVFVTTGDTIISPMVIEEARRRRVAIWHTVAFELVGSTTARPRLGLGPVVPRNPDVYDPAWPQPLPQGPTDVPFPVRRKPPRAPPVLLAEDPDPPETQ